MTGITAYKTKNIPTSHNLKIEKINEILLFLVSYNYWGK